ncbi:ATP-binding protein [bacterium]|nr:ATP-binding protein [bacterium]
MMETTIKGIDLQTIGEFNTMPEFEQKTAINMLENGAKIVDIQLYCQRASKRRAARYLREKANLSKRFSQRTFENFNAYTQDLKNAYEKAKKYADLLPSIIEDGTNIVFEGHGHVGVGKTHLAYSIANNALDIGIPTITINTMELIEVFNFTNPNKEMKQSLFDVDLLVIDDLGKECAYDWILSEMYRILNHRYENCKPTAITTEDTISTLRQMYKVKSTDGTIKDRGKSLFSRICENVVIVPVIGEDYRMKRFS